MAHMLASTRKSMAPDKALELADLQLNKGHSKDRLTMKKEGSMEERYGQTISASLELIQTMELLREFSLYRTKHKLPFQIKVSISG